jgi:hypothetical protein
MRVSITVAGRRESVSTHLPLSTGQGDIHEAAGICEPLLGTALGGLLLLLGLDL